MSVDIFRPQYIVLHHTVTPWGSGRQIADLQHYHLVLDYNSETNQVKIYQSLPDTQKSEFGTGGFNSRSYAVALTGNYEFRSPPPVLIHHLIQALVTKSRLLGITNVDRIVSHNFVGRHLAARKYVTACPGHYLIAYISSIRFEVKKRLNP